MFIGTSDYKTVEEFSKRCGNFSVITRNVGYNTVKADDINSNASIKERPLIYPSELSQLNRPGDMGNTIVTVFGYQPIRSKFTPSYAATAYTLEKTNQRLGVGRYFDEEKIFYDMKKRNESIVPRRRPMGGKRAKRSGAPKKDCRSSPFLARHKELESLTFGSVDQRSIQLS